METWYKASVSVTPTINEIQVDKSSDMLLTLPDGERMWKKTTYHNCFQDREEAKQYIIDTIENNIKQLEANIVYYQEKLKVAKEL